MDDELEKKSCSKMTCCLIKFLMMIVMLVVGFIAGMEYREFMLPSSEGEMYHTCKYGRSDVHAAPAPVQAVAPAVTATPGVASPTAAPAMATPPAPAGSSTNVVPAVPSAPAAAPSAGSVAPANPVAPSAPGTNGTMMKSPETTPSAPSMPGAAGNNASDATKNGAMPAVSMPGENSEQKK